jgi:hypothetical protein
LASGPTTMVDFSFVVGRGHGSAPVLSSSLYFGRAVGHRMQGPWIETLVPFSLRLNLALGEPNNWGEDRGGGVVHYAVLAYHAIIRLSTGPSSKPHSRHGWPNAGEITAGGLLMRCHPEFVCVMVHCRARLRD